MAQTTATALPKGFRGAELGWPELERIPHPPRRIPLVGDVFGADVRRPVQDSMRYGRLLGPVFRRKFFSREIVFVWGGSLAADLADESRFAKHVGLGVANLRPVAGDGCSPRTTTSPTGSWRTTSWLPDSAVRPWRATTR